MRRKPVESFHASAIASGSLLSDCAVYGEARPTHLSPRPRFDSLRESLGSSGFDSTRDRLLAGHHWRTALERSESPPAALFPPHLDLRFVVSLDPLGASAHTGVTGEVNIHHPPPMWVCKQIFRRGDDTVVVMSDEPII